jgi:hypothetical protein
MRTDWSGPFARFSREEMAEWLREGIEETQALLLGRPQGNPAVPW